MSEIDPDLGAAWRAASREQPPAALDERLRAAARREVSAKPGRLAAAPRWWPLAAAATVAAVAVGIVQMTPPEQVTPAALPPATNAARQEANADTPRPADTVQKRDAASTMSAEAQRNNLREEAKPIASEQKSRAIDRTNAGASRGAGSFAIPPGASAQDKKATLQAPAQPAKETTDRDQAAKQKTELAASLALARQSTNAVAPPNPPSRSEVRPFPASPVPAEGGSSNAPPPMTAAAPAPPPPAPAAALAPAPAAAPAPASASASAMSSRKLAAQSSPSSPPATAEIAGNAQPDAARTSLAMGKVASADANKSAQERRKDAAAPLAPDEWIKRIRRLIADGKNEDAVKELTAFRREYKERAESLLPSDLRTFRP